jgi:hypothetical protein
VAATRSRPWRFTPLSRMGPPPGASLPMRMTASWPGSSTDPAEYKVAARCAPEGRTPLGSSLTAARSVVACRRARVRQGQAFGGAEEAPSLTATARDSFLACCWSGREKACGAVEQEKWPKERKWSVLCNSHLTNRAPYKACSGFTRVTARRIAQPPKAAFVTGLRRSRLPGHAAR